MSEEIKATGPVASNAKFDLPFDNKTIPAMLEGDHKFCFNCHKDVSCFNECCKQADVTLAPYDIIRMKNALGMTSSEFLDKHTVPFDLDAHMPGVKLRTNDDGACLLVTEGGCSVYADRPTACRYYPIGLMSMKKQDEKNEEQHFFSIREEHCKGHDEDREITINEYRKEQGVEEYDDLNLEWYQLVLKKRTTGAAVGKPSDTSLQFFFMLSYDIDRFRRFAMSPAFQKSYELTDDQIALMQEDDIALLQFGYALQKQVLFGEMSVTEKDGAAQKRLKERKDIWEARREAEIALHQKQQDESERDETLGATDGSDVCSDN